MLELLAIALALVAVSMIGVNIAIVGMFLRRQRELEELALIEAKERREYLAQASGRMAVQTEQLRRREFGEIEEQAAYDHLSAGNRRMREGVG